MSVGFVAGSRGRKAVFSEVASGEREAARIAKKHRLVPRVVDEALRELEQAGLLAKGKEGFGLTAEGERVLAEMRRAEKPG